VHNGDINKGPEARNARGRQTMETQKMEEKISRMEQIAKRNHAQVLKIAQWGPGEARIFLQSRGVKWADQKAIGLFRKCVAFVEQHPKSHAVEKFTNPWHGEHLGFFFTSLANPERPEWMLDRCVNIEGVA